MRKPQRNDLLNHEGLRSNAGDDKTSGGFDGSAVGVKMELLIDHQRRVPAKRTQQKPSFPCGASKGFDRI